MDNDIKFQTIDDLRHIPYLDKQLILLERKKWLERERKNDRLQDRRIASRKFLFKYKPLLTTRQIYIGKGLMCNYNVYKTNNEEEGYLESISVYYASDRK
jgi:hypothetical protein